MTTTKTRAKGYTPLSKEEKQARLKELSEKLEAGVEDILDSEQFKEYLTFMASFYDYSWRNVFLIKAQMPEATMVAGFHDWKKKNRLVRKGSKGIKILAPLAYKDKETEDYVIRGFKVVHVFDVSQTDGEPLPESIPIEKLTGETDHGKAIWTLGESYCAAHGIPLKTYYDGRANGLYDVKKREILIHKDLEMDQGAKTLIHEICHHELHKDAKRLTRSTAETEAEGTAFVVCSYLGLPTEDFSFPYIAQYAGDKKVLHEALKVIQKASAKVIEDLIGKDDVA